jgi:hypothetical protein
MNATVLSATYPAYTWFTECVRGSDASQAEAHRFAGENWRLFLAHADKGWGRLLARLAHSPKGRRRRQSVAVG